MDRTSLEQNPARLKHHGFSLEALFDANKGTTLDYGSKFGPLDQLKKVMGDHPYFPKLAKILAKGMDYRYSKQLTEDERATKVLPNDGARESPVG
jgi:hypothetical protein